MKKLFGSLLVVIVGFTACEGPMGPEGPPGPVNIKYVDYTVNEADWELVGEPNMPPSYYIYEFDEPLITPGFCSQGTIVGYTYYADPISKSEFQTVLPYIAYDMDIPTTGTEHPFSVQFMCDFVPGLISFKVVFSDFYTAEYHPKTTKFRVMYIW